MSEVLYTVIATLPDEATAVEYIAWLRGGHVDRVVRSGAASGIVVRLDAEAGLAPRVMTQYVFPSREVYERYVREHAPVLRAEGLAKFPAERGVRWERMVGEMR